LITFGEAGPMIARVVAREMEQGGKEAGAGSGGEAGEPGSPPPSAHISSARRRLEQVTQVETLEEAVGAATRLAHSGDVVLLSPGGTSFDAFRDFAERGDRFKELVQGLPVAG
jgi:UDP-N-acetylmuramoylalanine--D-glutamate ligase